MGKMKDSTIPEWDQYSHDHLCPVVATDSCVICLCKRLAEARADERMKVMQQALQMGGDIYTGTTTHGDDWHDRAGSSVKRDAMAALESLAGK